MEREELNAILKNHKLWLETNGEEGVKADLSRANLKWVDLSGASLRGADLSGANLRGANLKWADLSDTDLRGADFKWADLSLSLIHIFPVVCGTLYRDPKGHP